MRRTGCYGCVRMTPADGACGVGSHPCIHYGADLFATDPQVFAPDSGRVVAVSGGESAPWRGYGPGVEVIKGDSGVFLLLAHLSRSTIDVEVGELVSEGQPIAKFDRGIGHTHFEVRRQLTGPSKSNTLDPGAWVYGPVRVAINIALFAFIAWTIGRYPKHGLL